MLVRREEDALGRQGDAAHLGAEEALSGRRPGQQGWERDGEGVCGGGERD